MKENQSNQDLKEKALMEFQKNQIVIWEEKTTKYIKEPFKLKKMIEEVLDKISKLQIGPIDELIESLYLIIGMIQDYINGNYKKLPSRTFSMGIMALLYFLVPTDIIPDWILSIGFLDDFVIITNLGKQMQKDIDEYKEWKENYIDDENNI